MSRKIDHMGVLLVILIMLTTAFAGCFWDDDDEKKVPPEEPTEYHFWNYYEDIRNFTTFDVATNTTYTTSWAVFLREHGGNGAEHYLATSSKGWIMNLGGEYPTWSEDRGHTWQDFRPISEWADGLGEGAIIETPDGDIVANSWYPYPPLYDELIFYYYDMDAGDWLYSYDDYTHPTFYDRSWQVVVPGPITSLQGVSSPWASLIVSNFYSSSGVGYIVSQDGLYYLSWPDPDTAQGSVSFDLDFEPGIMWDFMTPHREMDATPIPTGGLLMPNYFSPGESAYLDTNLVWRSYTPPSGVSIPAPHLVIDSTGALHSVGRAGNILTYHMSTDGGWTWASREFTWGENQIDEWEFQADGAHELAVINMRVELEEDGENVDKDIIFHIRDYRESLEPDTITLIGQGDADATSGLGNDFRFDFASLAILPDGGVVVSYQDSTDVDPLFAVELEVPYDDFEPPWEEE